MFILIIGKVQHNRKYKGDLQHFGTHPDRSSSNHLASKEPQKIRAWWRHLYFRIRPQRPTGSRCLLFQMHQSQAIIRTGAKNCAQKPRRASQFWIYCWIQTNQFGHHHWQSYAKCATKFTHLAWAPGFISSKPGWPAVIFANVTKANQSSHHTQFNDDRIHQCPIHECCLATESTES